MSASTRNMGKPIWPFSTDSTGEAFQPYSCSPRISPPGIFLPTSLRPLFFKPAKRQPNAEASNPEVFGHDASYMLQGLCAGRMPVAAAFQSAWRQAWTPAPQPCGAGLWPAHMSKLQARAGCLRSQEKLRPTRRTQHVGWLPGEYAHPICAEYSARDC